MFGLYNWFQAVVSAAPAKTALVTNAGRITYQELDQRINRLAFGLKNTGLQPGMRVGMLFHNSAQFVETYYALAKLGAVAAPINFRCNPEETRNYLCTLNCAYFMYGPEFTDIVSTLREDLSGVVRIGTGTVDGELSYAALMDNHAETWADCEDMPPESEAVILMTGGTTGNSRAAVHTKKSVLFQHLLPWVQTYDAHERQPDVSVLIPIPLFHIGGMNMLIDTLNKGGKAVLSSEFDPGRLVDIIESERITKMLLIPPNLAKSICESPSASQRDTSSVRTISTGGSCINPEQLQLIYRAFPNAEAELLYTSTEYSIVIRQALSREAFARDPELSSSLGTPAFFSSARLLDETGADVRPGETGELWGQSLGMMAQYIDSKRTSDAAWLPTGDLFCRDKNGRFYFKDRKKDMIKSGGENVYSNEVEAVILRHPKVAFCAVIGLPDDFYGEIVAAAVVLRHGESLSEDELIQFCKNQIASYKKPRKVFFVDSLPKSALGKVKKNLLREQLSAQLEHH